MSLFSEALNKEIEASITRLKNFGPPRNRAERILLQTCVDIIKTAKRFETNLQGGKVEALGVLFDHGMAELSRVDAYLFAVELYREGGSDEV